MPRAAGVIGRCLRERRPVIVGDVRDEPDYVAKPETAGRPLRAGRPAVGRRRALGCDRHRGGASPNAFDEDDARLVETVAGQVGSALRSAMLYERLDGAYIGTAEALATALEAEDAYPGATGAGDRAGDRGRPPARPDARTSCATLRSPRSSTTSARSSLSEEMLNKRGPLTENERIEVERHTVVGESILSSVEFLADVRPLVRHAHERWDGGGYPDGLVGEAIPLGARIVLACDAYDAMTADRPYREQLTDAEARRQLAAGAGSQFDPEVVTALLAVLEAS